MPGRKLAPLTTPLAEMKGGPAPPAEPAKTSRMRLWPVSAMKRFPALSTVTPLGVRTLALVAGFPSPTPTPANAVPLPANVVMVLAGFTMRIRLFCTSAM